MEHSDDFKRGILFLIRQNHRLHLPQADRLVAGESHMVHVENHLRRLGRHRHVNSERGLWRRLLS
jgi:hypothetical protein